MMGDTFSRYHPLVNFVYFLFVLGFSMVFIHPVLLGISLCCGAAYSWCLYRQEKARFSVFAMLPVLLITALLNPIFNHEGATILCYLWDGNPLTLESIYYGLSAGAMLCAILLWFSCYNRIMSSDKIVYLFGRVIPALSLVFSMILRFVPRFGAQLKAIRAAQHVLGRDLNQGNIWRRARNGMAILSILVTWALESSIVTADSMRSRGYGLKGRTSFSIFKWSKRDLWAMLLIITCGTYMIVAAALGGVWWQYYPLTKGRPLDFFSWSTYTVYITLLSTPLILNLAEDRKWKASQWKI